MATRRRGVKHRRNKTRTIIKALLRKTTYKNKTNKHHKTKKVYQSGGGPKVQAKGAKGVPTETKVLRYLLRKGKINQETFNKLVAQQKKDYTAEFDIDMGISGLPYHISVKSVKQKTPGQYSFTIMCGKSNRFFGQTGIGKVPYHMVVVIREKHRTDPSKTQYHALEINLRGEKGKRLLFGRATDCQIKEIVERAQLLSDAYCANDEDVQNNAKIAHFNSELKLLGAKIQLAPKKGNPEKKRSTRAQASITEFDPSSPTIQAAVTHEDYLSSAPNSGNSDEGINGGPAGTAPLNLTATSVSRTPGSRNISSRSIGSRSIGARSIGSRNTSSRRGVSKQPTPQVSYFRSFKPRERGTSQRGTSQQLSQQLPVVSQAPRPRSRSAVPKEGQEEEQEVQEVQE